MNWKNGNNVATDKCKIDFVVFISTVLYLCVSLFYRIVRSRSPPYIKRTVILIESKVLEPICLARYGDLCRFPFCDNRAQWCI